MICRDTDRVTLDLKKPTTAFMWVIFSHPLYICKTRADSNGRFVKTEKNTRHIQSATIRMLAINLLKLTVMWSWKMHESNRGPSVSTDSLCHMLRSFILLAGKSTWQIKWHRFSLLNWFAKRITYLSIKDDSAPNLIRSSKEFHSKTTTCSSKTLLRNRSNLSLYSN